MHLNASLLFLILLISIKQFAFSQNLSEKNFELNENWIFKPVNDSLWKPAKVPGCVHTDLLNNKLIADPYHSANENGLQWIDKKDWEYKTVFDVPANFFSHSNISLIFNGLDTYANVYLNDSLVLSANNMFRTWEINDKKRFKIKNNSLRIVFTSPINQGLKEMIAYGIELPNVSEPIKSGLVEGNKLTSQYTRKAPYQYGWDWGPRLVTSGIWKPIFIKAWDNDYIQNIQYATQEITTHHASILAKLKIESSENQLAEIEISCINQKLEKKIEKIQLQKGNNDIQIPIKIENPRLWWSNGLGEPFLYQFKTTMKTKGNIIDERNNNVGIRTIKLIQEKDSIGKSFLFELNGVRIFIKGANYIPNHVFPTSVSDETYEYILNSAKEANINMLRVWGGGIYENDLFYDLCDKKGILIWQDFMFSCALYPGNTEFLNNIKIEAEQNIIRLRNHPCMALWCGNNEIYQGWNCWGWKQKYTKAEQTTLWNAYDTIFNRILPKIVETFDGELPYWPTSPFQGYDNLLNFPENANQSDWDNKELWEKNSGDVHFWAVWFGKKDFDFYSKVVPRFVSEYGIQSFPELQSWLTVCDTSNLSVDHSLMQYRQRSFVGNGLIKSYMDMYFKTPNNFNDFTYISQIIQALCIQKAIEAHRNNMPKCMGSMYWQLNDCWVAPTWAGIDYTGRWKAMHYSVKRSFSNVIITMEGQDEKLNIKIVSDSLNEVKGELELKLYDFKGKVLWQKNIEAKVNPSSVTQVISLNTKEILGNNSKNDVVLHASFLGNKKVVANNFYYFVSPKDLNLSNPKIQKEIVQKNGEIIVKLRSNEFAKNVFLSFPFDGHFSDNNFDLLPHKWVEIKFFSKNKTDIKLLNNKLDIKSL